MLFDGRQRAKEIQANIKDCCSGARLVVVSVAPDPASMSYMRIKERVGESIGVNVIIDTVSSTEIIAHIRKIRDMDSVDGIVVQLPLPQGIKTDVVLAEIPPAKDPDALSPNAHVMSPVARAVLDVLHQASVNYTKDQIVVIGRGALVGRPVANMLYAKGAHLTILDEDTPREAFEANMKMADVVISGAGVPGLIQPHMLQRNSVLIDAGTSEQGGEIVGDADPACESVTRLMTPVPGGIGPLAVTMLFANVCDLIKRYE